MNVAPDFLASVALGTFAAAVLLAHRLAGAPANFERVARQGQTPFLRLSMMHAGYWMLQPVVRGCVRNGITPTVLSWFSLLPAVGAGWAAAYGYWGFAAWALLASALLDVLDGAVARASGTASKAGAVLDSVLDRYAEAIFFAGALVFYRHHLPAQLLVLGALVGSFLVAYSTAKAEAIQVTPPRGWMKRSDRVATLIVGAAITPLAVEGLTLPGETLAVPMLVALGVIALLGNVSAVLRYVALYRSARS